METVIANMEQTIFRQFRRKLDQATLKKDGTKLKAPWEDHERAIQAIIQTVMEEGYYPENDAYNNNEIKEAPIVSPEAIADKYIQANNDLIQQLSDDYVFRVVNPF